MDRALFSALDNASFTQPIPCFSQSPIPAADRPAVRLPIGMAPKIRAVWDGRVMSIENLVCLRIVSL
jgi:hypothetical protein